MAGKAKHTGYVKPVFDDSTLTPWEQELLRKTDINRRSKIDARSRESFEVSVDYGYTVRLVGGHPIDFKKVTELRTKPRTQKRRDDLEEDF